MAHDNKHKNGKNIKAISTISKAINKKGKIKGKNKKETKYLERACLHHYYNKKGKLKAAIVNNDNGLCVCELCGRSFSTKLRSKDDVRNIFEDGLSIVNQAAYAATSAHLGEEAIDKMVKLKVLIEEFPKDYSRIFKAVSKEESINNKKKKHNNSGNGSNQYGNWSTKK